MVVVYMAITKCKYMGFRYLRVACYEVKKRIALQPSLLYSIGFIPIELRMACYEVIKNKNPFLEVPILLNLCKNNEIE